MFADGDGCYTYKIYSLEEAKIHFNNGVGVQIPGVMEEGFAVSDEIWYRNGTWTKERPKEITVYFYYKLICVSTWKVQKELPHRKSYPARQLRLLD